MCVLLNNLENHNNTSTAKHPKNLKIRKSCLDLELYTFAKTFELYLVTQSL
jgi:hypothetical protein